ncbi:MAG: hypothetical protein JWO80_5146, partial [Bryobacterales bacterium]|nr:hypothetical protein [Bryobacterales bacterium]
MNPADLTVRDCGLAFSKGTTL